MNTEQEKKAISEDIAMIFDSIITKGKLRRKVELTQGVTIEIEVLNTGETLAAEAHASTNHMFLPSDIVSRGRIVSILTTATKSLNGIDIEQESLSKEENSARRDTLYKKYMALPLQLIDKAYDEYKSLQDEQAKIFSKPLDEFREDISAF